MFITFNRQTNLFFKKQFFKLLISLYVAILLFFTALSCHFSYQQRRENLLAQIDKIYIQLSQEFKSYTDNLWRIYMPFAESDTDVQRIWRNYFSSSPTALSPQQKNSLDKYMQQMLLQDNNVQWIVLYNENRDINYILYNTLTGLYPLSEDFPYLTELQANPKGKHIYEMRSFCSPHSDSFNASIYKTYAICNSIPSNIGSGKIMIGYNTASLYSICDMVESSPESLNFTLTYHDEILFDYKSNYNPNKSYYATDSLKGFTTLEDGQKIYVHSNTCGSSSYYLTYYLTYEDFWGYCHANTPLLITIFLLFAIISLIGYSTMLRMTKKEINIIREGLQTISENNLDYHLPVDFHHNGLPEIASSINQMAIILKNNINQLYYYEIKQREAQLSELQSKFNPHFLYNTLEMLRSRCQVNGDDATAYLISQMSTIFRGFIGSKNFVPFTEELTFSKHYLALFKARYEDSLEIKYDFDEDILKYGIVRNLFQPLIENYFVHGFDTSNNENYILFKGKSLDDKTMLLTVEDNGSGMSDEEIDQLNAKLHEPIQISTESYGLKNLHQRLQLFYGEGCGLTVYHNPNASKGCVFR